MERQIIIEMEHGNYVNATTKPTIVSSLGVIPKSNCDVRLIHDASLPLHKHNNFVDPIVELLEVIHMLTGVKRELGKSQNCKQHITPDMMLAIGNMLDLSYHNNVVFWAACLVGFWGFLRPNNFLVRGDFDPSRHLRAIDVLPTSCCFLLFLRVTKNITVSGQTY